MIMLVLGIKNKYIENAKTEMKQLEKRDKATYLDQFAKLSCWQVALTLFQRALNVMRQKWFVSHELRMQMTL
jgi:hypothetical protein